MFIRFAFKKFLREIKFACESFVKEKFVFENLPQQGIRTKMFTSDQVRVGYGYDRGRGGWGLGTAAGSVGMGPGRVGLM